MQVNLLLFGQLRDITGKAAILFNDVADTRHLLSKLNEMYPAMTDAKFIVAVNKQVVKENTALKNDSTVALLPPFSGG